jgi:hypothetical protein
MIKITKNTDFIQIEQNLVVQRYSVNTKVKSYVGNTGRIRIVFEQLGGNNHLEVGNYSQFQINGVTFASIEEFFIKFNEVFPPENAGGGSSFDGQLTQGGNPLSITNRLPVDIGGATVNIQGNVTVSNEVEITNELGNPIPTTNAELQTYLTDNIGLKTDEIVINENSELSLFSFIKGIFGKLKSILEKTPELENGNIPVLIKNNYSKIEVIEKRVVNNEYIDLLKTENITSFSIVADNPSAEIEYSNLGNITQPINVLSQDYHGAVLKTDLKYRIMGSDGVVTINKLV